MSRQHSGEAAPRWDRFSAAGADDRGGADFAPINHALFNHLPGWLAHGLLMAAQYGLGMTGIYLLSRRRLGAGRVESVLATGLFAGSIHPHLVSAVASFTPFVVFSMSLLIERKTTPWRWALAIAAILLWAWTGYFSRLIPYALLFVTVWFLFFERTRPRDWLLIVPLALAPILVRASDIAALIQIAPLSHTPITRYVTPLPEAWDNLLRLPHLPSPLTLGGAVVVILVGLLAAKGRDRRLWAAAILTIVGAQYLGPLAQVIQAALVPLLPFIEGYDFLYYHGMIALVSCTAAAHALTVIRARIGGAPLAERWKPTAAAVVLGSVVAVIGVALVKAKVASTYTWVTRGSFARNFDSPVLRDLAAKVAGQPFPVRVDAYQLPPGILHTYGLESAGGYKPIMGRRFYEYWGVAIEPWVQVQPADDVIAHHYIRNRNNRGGTMSFRGDRLELSSSDYRPEVVLDGLYRMNMLALANVGYLVSRDRLVHPWLEEIAGPAEPWSAKPTAERVRTNLEANFTGLTALYVYRNTKVLPRFFTVDSLRLLPDNDQVYAALVAAPVEDLARQAFARADEAPTIDAPLAPARLTLETYTSDHIRLAIAGDPLRPSLLVVTNNYSRFWEASIDGKPAPIFPIDHAFWGVVLPPGSAQIAFTYAPFYTRLPLLP